MIGVLGVKYNIKYWIVILGADARRDSAIQKTALLG